MTDILKAWLNQELELGVSNVEKDFANGFLWGHLFSRFNMQPDFHHKFEDRRMPDAMVNNYTRLQPTFKRLGIPFDSQTANKLMREEPGVALRILYSVKQQLGQVEQESEKFKRTGKLGKELGAYVGPNRVLLESLQYRTAKQTFEQGAHRFFEETIRSAIPQSTNQLLESTHLRKFSERQYKLEAAADQAMKADDNRVEESRRSFRTSRRSLMASQRSDKASKLDRDAAVHASLLRHKEEVEKEELKVELALAEANRRRKMEVQQQAAMDVTMGVDAFEINMKRLLKGDNDGDNTLKPATTHTPLEHHAKMRAMATSTQRLLEETAGYMSGVRAQRADDIATKREREARRRRMLVEQQAAAAEAERKAESEALLSALARQSAEEQRLAARLFQLEQEKEVMRENRALRESQYAERRARDWEETLRRGLELHRSRHEQYQAQAAAEMAAWHEAQQARAAAKAAKHQAMCEGLAWQLVQLAERAVEYRERTGELVPRGEWRRWLAMFKADDPQLGDPVVRGETTTGPALDVALAKAAVADWLECVGEYERTPPIGCNASLGAAIAELDIAARAKVTPGQLPELSSLPLRLAVVGAPFSGKTSVASHLASRFRLKLLEPEALIGEALKAADEWEAAQAAAAAAAQAGAGADAQQPQAAEGDASGSAGDQQQQQEEGTAPPEEPPQPPAKAVLGARLKAALLEGQDVPDDVLVPLMVLGMEEARTYVPPKPVELDPKTGKPRPPPKVPPKNATVEEEVKPPQGFVCDGFPRTAAQAALLERALTGLDLEAEAQVVREASRIAPPPPESLPQLQRPLTSGLDAVLVLGLSDPALALKRALGRRVDPLTGKVYHLEFAPPPTNDPGLVSRLREVADPSNDAAQVQQRLATHDSTSGPLEAWLKRFSRLVRPLSSEVTLPAPPPPPVDPAVAGAAEAAAAAAAQAAAEAAGSLPAEAQPMAEPPPALEPPAPTTVSENEPLSLLLQSAEDAAGGVLRAKAAVASCRSAAEAARKARVAAEKAQEFAELARSHAEGAARELLVAKKAEIQAAALLDGTAVPEPPPSGKGGKDKAGGGGGGKSKKEESSLPPDPAAVEVLKAQAAAKCAEQLKVCRGAAADAAGYAERASEAAATAAGAVEKARLSLGDAEVSATAEVEAQEAAAQAEEAASGAGEAAAQAQAALAAAEVAVKEADKFAAAETVAPDAQVELAPPAPASRSPSPTPVPAEQGAAAAAAGEVAPPPPPEPVPIPPSLAGALLKEWRCVESTYLEGLALGFANLAERHDLAVAHHDTLRTQFRALLARPDNRAALVTRFQKAFNEVDIDARKLRETQAELVLRSEELREALWGLCDKKMEEAEAERSRAASDSFVPDHTSIMSTYYLALAQMEVDRFYGTLSFVKGYAALRYGVLSPGDEGGGDVTSSPPDLASHTTPPELKDKLDEKSKTSMTFPSWVTSLAAKSPALATGLKVSLASAAAVITSLSPQPEDPKKAKAKEAAGGKGGKAGKGKDAKGGSGGEAAPEEEPPSPAVQEAMSALTLAVMSAESGILEERLQLLADRASAALEGVSHLSTRTLDTLGSWIRSRYQAECSAVLALDKVVKAAAVAGEPLPSDLRLEDDGTTAVVDATTLVLPPHPGFPPPKPQERPPPPTALSVAQLGRLVERLAPLAPEGLLKTGELADVLLRCIGDGTLPEGWKGTGLTAVQGCLQALDPVLSGYVDWREMVAGCLVGGAFPQVLEATCTDLAEQCERLLQADSDKDGLLDEREWCGSEMWFQRVPFTPGSEADLEAEHHAQSVQQSSSSRAEYDRAGELKKVLWAAFSRPAPEGSPAAGSPRLDPVAVLLYLAADRDHFAGIKKAFSVVANSIASNARVTAGQLFRAAYPLGPDPGSAIQRVPLDQEQVAQVVETIYRARGGKADGAPVVSAEQLMYSSYGEKVVSHLMGRYQWKDLYVATRLVKYA